jgi:hypothetical protein
MDYVKVSCNKWLGTTVHIRQIVQKVLYRKTATEFRRAVNNMLVRFVSRLRILRISTFGEYELIHTEIKLVDPDSWQIGIMSMAAMPEYRHATLSVCTVTYGAAQKMACYLPV